MAKNCAGETRESGGSQSAPAGSQAKQVLSDREQQRHLGRGTQMENNEILQTQRSQRDGKKNRDVSSQCAG